MTSNSGITHLPTGASIIPSSTRADGTVRKEIRVKPGYRPPEDVEVYKNRTAEAWKNRGKGGVPGAAPIDNEKVNPPQSVAAAKNAKRREREARKKAEAAAAGIEVESSGDKIKKDVGVAATGAAHEEKQGPEVDPQKEAKKLAKKLRQARELKDKKEKGGDLLPEQFAKVIKIQELMRQLDALGFDAEGEKRVAEVAVQESAAPEG